ncbi:MAG: hypothetical protein ABI822_18750 [Bryobacteraceae bacterium]
MRLEIELDGADKVVHRIDGKKVLQYEKLEIGAFVGSSASRHQPAAGS